MADTNKQTCPHCNGAGQIEIKAETEPSPQERRESHHGLASDGMHPTDKIEPTYNEDHAGLGAEGEKP